MAFASPPSRSLAAERSEQLARLVYELLDAHSDTERLLRESPDDLQWLAHLSYLRDLQRVGRQVLAQPIDAMSNG
jgi:hypothetical protein